MEIMKKALYKNGVKEPIMDVKVKSDIHANISTVTITKNGSEETCIVPYMNLAHTSDIRLIDTGNVSFVMFVTGRLSEKIIVIDTSIMEYTISTFTNLTNIKIANVRIDDGIVKIDVNGNLFDVMDDVAVPKGNIAVTFTSNNSADVCTMFVSNFYDVTGSDGKKFSAPIASSIGKASNRTDGKGKYTPIYPPVPISKSPDKLGLKVEIGNKIIPDTYNQNRIRITELEYGNSFEIGVDKRINDVDVDTMKTFVVFGGYRYIAFVNGYNSNNLSIVNIDKKRGVSYMFDEVTNITISDVFSVPSSKNKNGADMFIEGTCTVSATGEESKSTIRNVEFNFYLDEKTPGDVYIKEFLFDNDRIASEGCSINIFATTTDVDIITNTVRSDSFLFIYDDSADEHEEHRKHCDNCCNHRNESDFDRLRYITGNVMERIECREAFGTIDYKDYIKIAYHLNNVIELMDKCGL